MAIESSPQAPFQTNPLPDSMKALWLIEPGLMKLETVPVPVPGPGEVLIQVMASTTCGTDLKAFERGHPQIPMPGPMGHEYSGIVCAVGSDAPFKVGDAIMGVHSAPCQSCKWCLRGQENLCETIMSSKVLGSFAEYLLIPARIARLNAFLKPEAISFRVASLLEPLSCVAQGLVASPAKEDDSVLVIGPGAIGLMFVAALGANGVKNVKLVGRNAARLAAGEQLGAEIGYLADEAGQYDLVIECTGKVEVWEKAVSFATRGATVNLFGGCPGGSTATFSTDRLHYDQIGLISPFHFGTHAVRQAKAWLESPGFDLTPLISGDCSLDNAHEVFTDLREGRGIKYAFRPQAF